MNRKSRYTDIHKCKCEECGHIMYVPRTRNHLRENGHKKHMYCPTCQKRTLHIEQNEYDTRWDDRNIA